MNLRTLRYFKAIADAGSFTAAASLVSIAQPALTRQIRALEADLGVQLLSRSVRGVRLTPAGVSLYESAKRMLDEEARVMRELGGTRSSRKQAVGIGISPTLAGILLPKVFDRCFKQIDGIELVTREATSPILAQALEIGSIDLAVLTNPTPSSSVSLEPLLSEPFALVSAAHKYMAAVVPLNNLGDIPLLMTPINRLIVEEQLAPFGVSLQVQAEIDSVAAIRELVMLGTWATLMPVSTFKSEACDQLLLTEITGIQLHRTVALATRIDNARVFEVSAVAGVVRSEMQRLTSEGVFGFRKPQ
jgi:LysR family nitrogen assimilation transcriptional regulator